MAHRFNKTYFDDVKATKLRMKADIDTIVDDITALDTATLNQTKNIVKDVLRIERRLIKMDLRSL